MVGVLVGAARGLALTAAVVAAFWNSFPQSTAAAQRPLETPPVVSPTPYRLGPGDVLAISVWGHADLAATVEVRPDGYVAFPLVGELRVDGLTPGQLAQELARRLSEYVREPRVTVSLQQFRTLQASILGAVRAPGTYVLRFDARLPDLLGRGGGLLEEADASAAVLSRTLPDGSTVAIPVDLTAILQGRASAPELASGDVLYVPPARPAVVLGAVNSPGPYPVRPGMRLLDLVAAAGGWSRRADPSGARLIRSEARGSSSQTLSVDLEQLMANPLSAANVSVRPGDVLFVPEARELVVLGAVRSPGAHPFSPGMRLLDALALAGGPDPERAGAVTVIRRSTAAQGGEVARFEIQRLLRADPSANPPMLAGDVVLVEEAPRSVAVLGEVARPGAVPYRPGLTLLDALAQAGGPTERAELAEALLTRVDASGTRQVMRLDLRALLQLRDGPGEASGEERPRRSALAGETVKEPGDTRAELGEGAGSQGVLELPLQPGDVLVLPRVRRQVIVLGAVTRPGAYEFQEQATLLDALALAGGVDFTRAGPVVTVNRRAASSGRSRTHPDGPAAGGERLEISLQRLLAQGDPSANVRIEPGDVVVVAEAPLHVAVLGEVARPGSFPLRPGMRALDALAQAGGLLETADPSHIVLLRGGQQRLDYEAMLAAVLDDAANPPLQAGDVLVVERADRRVLVLGSVVTPQALSFRPGLRLLDAVAMAGGPREDADLTQVTITRSTGTTEVVNLADLMGRPATESNVILAAGDVVFVPPSRTVLVLGAVARPGGYAVPPGARVLDVLGLAGGVRPGAGVATVLVSRTARGGESTVYALAYDQLLQEPLGPANLPVAGGDVVYVPEGQRQVLVLGQVRNPGVYTLPAATPTRLLDVLAMAGGPTPRARLEAVGILRSAGERQQASLGRGARLFQGQAEQNPLILPGDVVYVPETRWPDWREIFGFVAGINTFVELVERLR